MRNVENEKNFVDFDFILGPEGKLSPQAAKTILRKTFNLNYDIPEEEIIKHPHFVKMFIIIAKGNQPQSIYKVYQQLERGQKVGHPHF